MLTETRPRSGMARDVAEAWKRRKREDVKCEM